MPLANALLTAEQLGQGTEATYPLDQYQTALRHAQKNARTGKVLFTPNGAGAFTMPAS